MQLPRRVFTLSLFPALSFAEGLWSASTTKMSLGSSLSITFDDAVNVARVEQPNVYYDNRGVYDNDQPSNGQGIEKFIFLDASDVIIFRFTVYNDYIFHVQTRSKNVEISMENSSIGSCTTKLIGDKIFDLNSAKFKCGKMDWADGFTCDKMTAGIHKRNGGLNNVKVENWISWDVSSEEMDVEYTVECDSSNDDVDDIFTCKNDPDYYEDTWQTDVLEICPPAFVV